MTICIVELTTLPADEHFNRNGFALLVELLLDNADCSEGRYWKRPTQAMEWMEHASPPAVRVGAPEPLRHEISLALWNLISSLTISPFAEGRFGYIHPTTFRLKISSAVHSCELFWTHELPPAWSALRQIVQLLESIAGDGVSARTTDLGPMA